MKLRQLDEMDMGDLEGMSVEGASNSPRRDDIPPLTSPCAEIGTRYPEEYRALKANPLFYRYPRGESYEDLIHRLEPLIFEIERCRQPMLIVAHNAVLQWYADHSPTVARSASLTNAPTISIYAYLMNKQPEETPFIEIPHHAVIELIPGAAQCHEARFRLLRREVQSPPPPAP